MASIPQIFGTANIPGFPLCFLANEGSVVGEGSDGRGDIYMHCKGSGSLHIWALLRDSGKRGEHITRLVVILSSASIAISNLCFGNRRDRRWWIWQEPRWYLCFDSRARKTPHRWLYVFFGIKKDMTSMPILETQKWAWFLWFLVNGVHLLEKGKNYGGRSFISKAQPGEHYIGGCIFILKDRIIFEALFSLREADMQRFVSGFGHKRVLCWEMKEGSRLSLYIDSKARRAPP